MAGRLFVVVSLTLACWSASVVGQENAQTRIPASLEECYRDQELFLRDNRLPHTPEMLIELIRKVEDSPDWRQDMRQLATSLVHRFRLDGIEREPNVAISEAIIPFSPSGFQFTKHRAILSRLLPGNAVQFPNDTLTATERVSKPKFSKVTHDTSGEF
ncbi:hypothetical protein DMENIID0001_047090 [Sergentomyia squamirostris]